MGWHTRRFIARMAAKLAVVFLLAFALAATAQYEPDPEALLHSIRARMADHLSHLPNYTCLEVVDRWVRRATNQSLEPVDRVEFEVAFVGSREYFAPRGGSQFDSASITKVARGTIGNGAFGAHLVALFDTDSPTFKYAGPSKKDRHKTFRYDFVVPEDKSHFSLKGSGQGLVGYKGSFWVDAESLDLVRLELTVDHIPSHIGISVLRETLQYSMVRIMDSEFLLARKSEMSATDERGNYSLNLVRLEGCREFRGDSVVRYDAPTDKNANDGQTPPDQ